MLALSRPVRRIALALIPALALIVPARSAAADCGAPLAQTFLPWYDPGWYAPLSDAGFEADPGAWTLIGGARVVAGNEPYHVGSTGDRRSLALPPSSSATSAAQCIGLGHPTIRFFARSLGSPDATLAVSVSFRDASGAQRSLPIGAVSASRTWAPTPPLPVTVNTLALLGVQQARFVFAPLDGGGPWWIDDVYVDPYGKG